MYMYVVAFDIFNNPIFKYKIEQKIMSSSSFQLEDNELMRQIAHDSNKNAQNNCRCFQRTTVRQTGKKNRRPSSWEY